MRLGVVIADTYPDKRIARFAAERTLREFPADECLLLSDSCFVRGARHVYIPPLSSISEYNELILDRLHEWADSNFYLLIQWDGFVLDGQRWRSEFLRFDYIGAPWPHLGSAVGAGGFSLRSQNLIQAIHRLRQQEMSSDILTAEDVQICFKYRAALREAGIRIARTKTAYAFAFERLLSDTMPFTIPASFGFHGVFNFPLVLTENEILLLFDSMLPRMGSSIAIWYLFLLHAWQRGYQDLGIKAMTALGERSTQLCARVMQICLKQGMDPNWLRSSF